MKTLHIATACLITRCNKILLVRKHKSHFWILPGGKIDHTETALQALHRELQEELQWNCANTPLQLLGQFKNRAANEANTEVQAQIFYTYLNQTIDVQIAAEIAAMQWWPMHIPMDASFAPLLREMVIPALTETIALQ